MLRCSLALAKPNPKAAILKSKDPNSQLNLSKINRGRIWKLESILQKCLQPGKNNINPIVISIIISGKNVFSLNSSLFFPPLGIRKLNLDL